MSLKIWKNIDFSVYQLLCLFLIVSIWAFNEDKYITYPIKIIYILVLGFYWIKKHAVINKYHAWCIIMIFFSIIAVFYAKDYSVALYTFVNIVQVILIAFVTVSYIDSNDKLIFMSKSIIIGGCVLLLRLVAVTPLSSWLSYERLGSHIGYNANDVGNKAAIAAIVSIGFARMESNKKKKLLYLFLFAALLVIVLFSGSRKSLLAVIIAVAMFYTLGLKEKRYMFLSIFGVGIAFVLLYFISMNNDILYSVIGRRIESMYNVIFHGQSEASSIDLRYKYMNMAWTLFKNNPLNGVGLGNFKIASNFGVYSHCDYLEVLCSYGIIGAVFYYLPIITVALRILTFRKKDIIDWYYLILVVVLMVNYVTMVMYTSAYTQIIIILAIAYTMLRVRGIVDNEIQC